MSKTDPRILLVDDDVDICHNLADILSDLDYHVDYAHDGPSALELVRRNSYDVALLDLKMPGMDGLTLYREIKKLRAGTVAVIVTAYASSSTAEAALAAGAVQILAKPVNLDLLLNLLAEAMGRSLLLIVDDDRDLCANLWDLLRDRGYRVSLAHDELEAIEQIRQETFDAVLIDLKLPEGDSERVYREVREANPEARTVLITGYPAELNPAVSNALTEGADAICYKPFEVPALLRVLGDLTQRDTVDNSE